MGAAGRGQQPGAPDPAGDPLGNGRVRAQLHTLLRERQQETPVIVDREIFGPQGLSGRIPSVAVSATASDQQPGRSA